MWKVNDSSSYKWLIWVKIIQKMDELMKKDWLIDWLCDRFLYKLIDWLIGWLVGWLIDWLIDWLKKFPHWLWNVLVLGLLDHENFASYVDPKKKLKSINVSLKSKMAKMLFHHLQLEWGLLVTKFNSGPLPVYSPISFMYPGAISPLCAHQGP